jgi:lipopolysaccharide O-acetyltransferase
MNKYVAMLRQGGLWDFVQLVLRKLYFTLYRYRFKRCGSILLSGSYRITGHRFIEIGRLSAGTGFRVDAIHTYIDGSTFAPSVVIGDNVNCGPYVRIGCTHRVVIGNGVLIGSYVLITDHDHGVYDGPPPHSPPDQPPAARALTRDGTVVIGDNVFIGEHVSILKNVSVGAGSVLASGSVVTRDVPPATIVAGSPARVVKRYDPARREWVRAE